MGASVDFGGRFFFIKALPPLFSDARVLDKLQVAGVKLLRLITTALAFSANCMLLQAHSGGLCWTLADSGAFALLL